MNPNIKGSQLWKLRKRHGRGKKYETPGALWSAAVRYFEWAVANPIMQRIGEADGNNFRDTKIIPHMRAFTIDGLSLHLGMTPHAWRIYRSRPEFEQVCAEIEAVIREQKFTGAACGVLNANIISQDLGLKNRVEITGEGGGPIETAIEWVKSSNVDKT